MNVLKINFYWNKNSAYYFSVGRSEDYGESVKGELVAVGEHQHQNFLFPAGVLGDFGQFGDFLNRQQRQQPITYSSSPPKIVPLYTDCLLYTSDAADE